MTNFKGVSPLARLVSALSGSAPIIPADGIVRRTLPTGLQLVVAERPGTGLVAFDLRVRQGSGDETPETSGLAHAVEHLVFKGTSARGVGAIDDAFERLGGELSARTSRDATQFSVTVPETGWRAALALLAETVRQPTLRPEDWRDEQPVIYSEMALLQADVDRSVVAALAAGLYPPSEPYSLPLLGTRENLARFTANDLRAHWRIAYRPSRMTLTLAGAVTATAAGEAALRIFSGLSAVPDIRPPRRAIVRDEMLRLAPLPSRPGRALATVALGWTTLPAADSASSTALNVLAELLGREDRGALARPLVRESRRALRVEAEHLMQRAGGLFTIRLTVPVEGVARAEDEARILLRRLAEDGFAPEDVAAARRRVLAQIAAEEATVDSLARRLGFFAGIEAPTLGEEIKQRLAQLGPDDVLAALRRTLRLDRGATVTLAGGDTL